MTNRVLWALPTEIAAADAGLVEVLDSAVREGEVRAGAHLACRVGCTGCCIGPFDITALDAGRLLGGVAELARRRPAEAAAIAERASVQWSRSVAVFPGDPVTGVLSPEDAAREGFFARFADLPCPALDPASGACSVYTWRPLSCRTYGLPSRCGVRVLPPCPLSFVGAPATAVAAAAVEIDPEDREGRLLDTLAGEGVAGDTTVCAVLAIAGLP